MKLADCNYRSMEPWRNPVYEAQCLTGKIAQDIAKDHRSVLVSHDILAASRKPPFCLRIVRAYRTPEIQAFRDSVANEARRRRNQ